VWQNKDMPKDVLSQDEVFDLRDKAARNLGPDPDRGSKRAEIDLNAQIARKAIQLVENDVPAEETATPPPDQSA
jgi:hypothetical protein